MITIAIKEKDFKKAKEIGENFRDYAPIQSQMITIETEEGNFEKAKEIGERFKDDALIQSQMITIAIKERDFKTIKKIGKKFLNNEVIQLQIKEIKMKDESHEEIEKEYNLFGRESEETEGALNKIKTKIYYGLDKIDEQEILQNEGKQQIHIYNEVMEYLLEKRKTIYVKMQSTDLETQREGISQWDKLDDLIEKTKELKENKDYMKSIYERVTRLKEKEENQIRR